MIFQRKRLLSPEFLSLHQVSLYIFLLALAVRLALIVLLHPYHDRERFELERTALSLATTGVYGNPYAVPTGPTAHVSPGYTLILAALFRMFGSGTFAEVVKEFLASSVSAAQCALVPMVASSLSLTKRVGLVAGVACAVLPVKPLVQIDGDWEAPYTAFFLLLLIGAVTEQWIGRDTSVWTAIKLGLLWGLAAIFSSVLLPIFFALLIVGAWTFRQTFPRYTLAIVIQVAIVFLCLTPWIIRNATALGSPIATRSNFGIEMNVSNNPIATPDQRVNYNLGVYDRYHPLQNLVEAAKVRDLGEVRYNKLVLNQANRWISSNQKRFRQLCVGRFWAFWLYPDPSKPKALYGYLTALLGVAGLTLLSFKKPQEGALVIAVVLLLYPAPNYLIQVGARQRYPIDSLLTLLSTYTIFWIMQSATGRNEQVKRS